MGNKKQKTPSDKNSYGYFLGSIGNILLWVVISAYFVILPLYLKNGYEMVATNKYLCFTMISKISAIVLGIFVVLYFATWGMYKEELAAFKPLAKIDISVLAFIVLTFVSYLISTHKVEGEKEDFWFFEGAFYGTSGWFMGFMTYLILAALYFVISRFLRYSDKIWIPALVTATLVFVLGIINGYGAYPIEMALQRSGLVSTVGNINWYAGFQSVLLPIFYGFYIMAKEPIKRLLFAVLILTADTALLVNGSDSIVFGFLIMSLVYLIYSVKSEKKLIQFLEVTVLFLFAGLIVRILDAIFPGQRSRASDFANIFTEGAASIILLIAFCGLVFFSRYRALSKNKKEYSEKTGLLIKRVLIIASVSILALLIILITVNTKTNGALPLIGDSPAFIFNDDWGSSRGATWSLGLKTFADLPFISKLFGAGPDCFYFAMKDDAEAFAIANGIFGSSRLTNAHCEIITLLVNVGILGTLSFLAICYFSIREFLKRADKNPLMLAFSLSIVLYLANNVFSFEQLLNIPFLFLVIAIGASCIASAQRGFIDKEPKEYYNSRH